MNVLKKIVNFYIEGFKNMTWGKTLWLLILFKLFIFFFIMKIFFLPDLLQSKYSNDEERAEHVLDNLTNTK